MFSMFFTSAGCLVLILKLSLISRGLLCVLLQVVESTYNKNPYHNAMHAADVTQSVMCMLVEDGVDQFLPPLELFCVIISCCIHDVGHFGVNNDFLVKTQHAEAFTYNDVRCGIAAFPSALTA